MANLRNLSPSHIRYLLTMQELDRQGKGVRSSDIAAALGLSKPSVHNMMKTFMDFGLVRKDAYGAAFFTRMREEQTAVCALLSQIPDEELEALCRRNGGESAS